QARRRVAELKEQETHGRAARRQAEGAVAQVTARHDALAELERERVGLAPAAQALLKAREQFGDAVIGPLSDFVRTTRRDAVLAGGEKGGRALRRANGAVFLAGPTAAGGGPLERRAELEALAQEVREAETRRGGAATTLERTLAELAAAEAAFAAAGAAAERA